MSATALPGASRDGIRQSGLEGVGIEVTKVNLRDVNFPAQVDAARVVVYRYAFTSREERASGMGWWRRQDGRPGLSIDCRATEVK